MLNISLHQKYLSKLGILLVISCVLCYTLLQYILETELVQQQDYRKAKEPPLVVIFYCAVTSLKDCHELVCAFLLAGFMDLQVESPKCTRYAGADQLPGYRGISLRYLQFLRHNRW